jgi:hypothetical protein
MSDTSSNSDSGKGTASASADDALQFLTRMWNPFGFPMPGMPAASPAVPSPAGGGMGVGVGMPSPASMFMSLDPAEIDRKIGELRVIENWLRMSLDFMQMSIKTMELQKASLEALRGSTTMGASGKAAQDDGKSGEQGKRAPRK